LKAFGALLMASILEYGFQVSITKYAGLVVGENS